MTSNFEEGDRVRHPYYGHATVVTARRGVLEINYDTGTTVKVANIDALEKLEEGDEGFVPWYEKDDESVPWYDKPDEENES